MKITLLDSIMHGPLKPWLLKPNVIEQFVKRLSQATAIHPVTMLDVQNQLNHLVQDYPTLVKYIKDESPNHPETRLVHHFYEITPPQHTNAFQQFYYLLYLQECLRFFNALIIKIDALNTQDDKAYQLEKVFTSLRVLTIIINDALTEYENEASRNDNVCYALTVARYMLIVLFFEIQDYFSLDLESSITPKFFFQNYLHIPYPNHFLVPSNYYYENFFLKMYHYDRFEIDLAQKYLKEIKEGHLKNDEKLLARYENGIFLYENGYNPDTVFRDFSIENNESVFREIKEGWLLQIDTFNTGYKRLNFINDQLDALQYVDDDLNNRKSIPSRLLRFLTQQKEIYANQLSVEFKTDISLYQEQTIMINNPPEADNKDGLNENNSSHLRSNKEKSASESSERMLNSVPDDSRIFKFGFKGRHKKDRVNLLRSCIIELCDEVKLLNENISTADDLCDLLISNQVKPGKKSIRLNCYTPQFYYIIESLSPYFSNLNGTSIDWSMSFITKSGTLLKRSNYYRNKTENPQQKKEIDNIIRQLQE